MCSVKPLKSRPLEVVEDKHSVEISRGSWKARCRIFWYAALWTQPDLVDRRSLITILKVVSKASSGYQMQGHTWERSVFMAVMVPSELITVLVARTGPLSLLIKCWTAWKNMAIKLLQQIQQQILARIISLMGSNRYGRYGHCTSKLKAIQATTKSVKFMQPRQCYEIYSTSCVNCENIVTDRCVVNIAMNVQYLVCGSIGNPSKTFAHHWLD